MPSVHSHACFDATSVPVFVFKSFANFMEGTDSMRLTGQFWQTDAKIKECPFKGITNDGRVWRKCAGKQGLECGVKLCVKLLLVI